MNYSLPTPSSISIFLALQSQEAFYLFDNNNHKKYPAFTVRADSRECKHEDPGSVNTAEAERLRGKTCMHFAGQKSSCDGKLAERPQYSRTHT